MSKPVIAKHSTSVPPTLRLASLHSSQSSLPLTFRSQGAASYRAATTRRTMSTDLDEQKEVEMLSDWNKPAVNTETLMKMRAAAFSMSARSGKNDVEKLILQRRSKGSSTQNCLTSSESLMKHIQEVTYRRLLKKEEEHLGKERSKNARRYEDELQASVVSLQDRLAALISQAKRCREEASRHRGLIFELESSLKSSKKTFLQPESWGRMGGKSVRAEDIFRVVTRKSQQRAFLFSREQDCREKVVVSKDAICRLRLEAEEFDRRAQEVDKELAEVKRVQTNHYCTLLKEGKDTRAQGLAWVVKRLWKAGEQVSCEMFPEFLDDESIRIILFIAQKSMEADDLGTHLLCTKPPSNTIDLRNTQDHWNNIHTRLKALTTNLSRKHCKTASTPVTFQVKILPSDDTLAEPALNPSISDVLSQYSDVKAVEGRIKELHELIQKVQNVEIRRLTTECFLNSYEKRYNVSMKTLLAAVVGVDVLDRYIATVNKEQKTLSEQLSQTKTFCFMSSNP